MPDSIERTLLSDSRLSASLRLVLEYYFKNGGSVKALFSHNRRSNTYVIVNYRGVDIPLRSADRYFSNLLNSEYSNSIAANKYITSKFLSWQGLNSPKTVVYKTEQQAAKFLLKHKRITVKPITGLRGDGVTTSITSRAELNRAIIHARKFSKEVLLQEHVEGEDYRLLFVNYRLVAALKRHRPYITGDGQSTISKLIKNENERRRRLARDEEMPGYAFWRNNPISSISLKEVGRQNGARLLKQVPDTKEKVTILKTANISAGAFSEDIKEQVNGELIAKLGQLLRSLDMGLCGIDILSSDISAPEEDKKSQIIEINGWPGLLPHARPHHGKSRNIGKAVAEAMYHKQKQLLQN